MVSFIWSHLFLLHICVFYSLQISFYVIMWFFGYEPKAAMIGDNYISLLGFVLFSFYFFRPVAFYVISTRPALVTKGPEKSTSGLELTFLS